MGVSHGSPFSTWRHLREAARPISAACCARQSTSYDLVRRPWWPVCLRGVLMKEAEVPSIHGKMSTNTSEGPRIDETTVEWAKQLRLIGVNFNNERWSLDPSPFDKEIPFIVEVDHPLR